MLRAGQRHRQTKVAATDMLSLKPPPTLPLYSPIYRDYGDTTAFTYIALNVDRKLIGRPLGAGQARPQATKPGRRRGSIR
jgi:hypothetical protein